MTGSATPEGPLQQAPAEAAGADRVSRSQAGPVVLLALVIAVVVQWLGSLTIPLGTVSSIVLFPMVWGLLVGAIVSIQRVRPLGLDRQRFAQALVGIAVLLLVARLAFVIGPNLDRVLQAGPALLLQEVGHLLGTVALALPLAVLLKMGPATIGATFSLDREPAFAMVNEKYGPDSDQYRGVLAMYIFGTLFGAVFITLLTSFVAGLDIFDPSALAMGAGVGSGSMLAASVAAIVAAYPAEADIVGALSAVSNLITTVLGVYVGIWIALPLADRFYRFLTRRQQSVQPDGDTEANREFRQQMVAAARPVSVPLLAGLALLSTIGVLTAIIAASKTDKPYRVVDIVAGYLVMIGLILLSELLHRVARISTIVWVTTIGALISSPWSPIGKQVAAFVGSVDFLSIATVVLVCAGLALGKDVPLLRSIGWKIIPVGLTAIAASFLLATIIAEFALGLWHA